MKALCVTTALLLLSACSTVMTPDSVQKSDWQAFGLEQGEKGLIKLSQNKLQDKDTTGQFNSDLYLAYSDGYEVGRGEYCQQSAYMLGVTGRPYYGVCDNINIWFRQDYQSGRLSTAGGY
ncbi:DUF2799 domain-containing protein [Vibrio agarivorans]|uniref:DUF2799 domain-containing protein n=1 Tax=Vibrio agarivorans TaxID=153622 RepID=A0ABT7Y2A7_9VIBR|nr:DUF2799 domain-containing protein [Vibrio agarivorans]MDN2482172.1 DUF2799 domain-containing protein [Vibrio agarivorans]